MKQRTLRSKNAMLKPVEIYDSLASIIYLAFQPKDGRESCNL